MLELSSWTVAMWTRWRVIWCMDDGEGHWRSLAKNLFQIRTRSFGRVIGQNLPISKIVAGICSQSEKEITRILGSVFSAWELAAEACMTTDTFLQLRSQLSTIGGVEYRLAGMDKGAGMIHRLALRNQGRLWSL